MNTTTDMNTANAQAAIAAAFAPVFAVLNLVRKEGDYLPITVVRKDGRGYQHVHHVRTEEGLLEALENLGFPATDILRVQVSRLDRKEITVWASAESFPADVRGYQYEGFLK